MKPKFIAKAKITKTGQLTIPSEARSAIGVDVNEDMYWYEVNGSLVASKHLMCEEDLASYLSGDHDPDRRDSRGKRGKKR